MRDFCCQQDGRSRADPIVSEADQLLTETYTDQVSEGYMLMAAGSGDHGASGQEDGEEEQEESQESDETQEEETSDDQTETETGTPESGDGQQTASDNGADLQAMIPATDLEMMEKEIPATRIQMVRQRFRSSRCSHRKKQKKDL